MSLNSVLDGMEGIWIGFLLGSLALTAGLAAGLQRWQTPCWRRLLRGQAGVSYTLPFVLTIPLYLIVMLAVFEMGFLLVAKIGTLYAAHAAVRAQIVWGSALPVELREPRVHQAAATAMC